jgi:Ca2+-binding EF-hand superfamily protein
MGEKSSKHGRPIDAGDVYETYQLVDKSGLTTSELERLRREYNKEVKGHREHTISNKKQLIEILRKLRLFEELMRQSSEQVGFQEPTTHREKKLEKKEMKAEDLFEYAADILWPLFDANNDGKIDFNEFSIAISVMSKGTVEQKAQLYWSCFDRDGSGDVTREELVTLFKMIAKGVKINFIARAKAGYKELHLHKKGISRTAFKEFIEEISKRLDSEDIAKAAAELCLKYADANKDGKVSKAEYIKWATDAEQRKIFKEQITAMLSKELKTSNADLQTYISNYLNLENV